MIKCDKFVIESQTFILNKTLEIKELYEEEDSEGCWSYECSEFGIFSYGRTKEESWYYFRLDFAYLWSIIAQEKDYKLTSDAIVLKKKLLALVNSVKG